MGLDGAGMEAGAVESVVVGGRRYHRASVEERPQDGRRLFQPAQPIAPAGAEVDPERPVLRFEPAATDSQDRPSPRHVIEGRDLLGQEPRVPEGVGAGQHPQRHPLRHLRPGREQGVGVEGVLVGLAHAGEGVLPGPKRVVSQLLCPAGSLPGLRPREDLIPQLEPELDGHDLTLTTEGVCLSRGGHQGRHRSACGGRIEGTGGRRGPLRSRTR